MKNKFLFILICLFAFQLGCQAVKDADDVADIRGGRCNLKKTSGFTLQTIMCFDFVDGYNANLATSECAQYRTDYNTSLGGMNGDEFTSGDANPCETSSTVGICTVANKGIMYYYNNYWTSGNAQTDCTSHLSGTWTP